MRRLLLSVVAAAAVLASLPARPAPAGARSADEKLLKEQKVPTDGPGLLEYLRKRSHGAVSEARIKELIEQLGDDRFAARQAASRALVEIGPRARARLQEALKHTDLEVRCRAKDCLKKIAEAGNQSGAVMAAAVRLLAARGPDGAVKALLNYLPSAEDAVVGEEVRLALAGLAVRDGKADPLLVAALEDASPAKRAGAAVALCRAKAPGQTAAVKKLLEDKEPRVRLEVALALAARGEKAAVPALIAAAGGGSSRLEGLAEDLLFRLAGDKAPELGGDDKEARAKYRKAWEAWWKQAEAKVDAAALEGHARVLGHTTVALLDENEVIDLDAANRVRWRITGLQMPLDVQRLPKERVLVAEYKANRVTERDSKGEVLWEHKIAEPLVAQRLANGNTFIANDTGTVEVNAKGEKVASYTPANGARVLRARKLPGGDTLLITQLGTTQLVRVDKDGKQTHRMGAEVATSGGRIDLTPAGTVLIPELNNNRVVERTMEGKQVRVYSVPAPVVALALPNGHVIITSNTLKRAVEYDRAGKEVWEYRRDTRVTRAVRH